MAATPFNFYRGSAVLFYQDLKVDKDPYIEKNNAAGQIFIHGDLHAQNFGTYLNCDGMLNFDVNDFDESYLGPFTWDVKRLLASLNILCYTKGFSDNEIKEILYVCVKSYVNQVNEFCIQSKDHFALTLKNTSGQIKKLLNETRVKSHVDLLNSMTCIENYDRRFIRTKYVQNVDKSLYNQLMTAFQGYLDSIPENKKYSDRGYNGGELTYNIKDIVQCSSPGIGSAGKVSYNFLIEGRTETLENDIVLYMKPAQKSAVSYVVHNDQLDKYFQHDGLRTVLCSYAMQASTPRWLGYTTLNSIPCMVDSITAHSLDLDWTNINDLNDVLEVVQFLGLATAKIHCVADSDCVDTPKDIACLPFAIIPREIEKTIQAALQGQVDEFMNDMVEFGMIYGELVRRDHHLFFEAFRNHQIPGL
ncbi:hypothetical protein I4U23_014603 [Adineta vaga]|nr:hypothetical protein I4U23_014603 [Adineta vaga]